MSGARSRDHTFTMEFRAPAEAPMTKIIIITTSHLLVHHEVSPSQEVSSKQRLELMPSEIPASSP
jgi:hypothetical protein